MMKQQGPTPQRHLLNGMRFNVLDWSNTSTQPVIFFLHGGGMSARSWEPLCGLLRDRFRCIALDLRGHGESDWSPTMDYRLSTHANDVRCLIEKVGEQPLAVVGMSLGGLVAMEYATREYAALDGLVVVDVTPWASSLTVDSMRRRLTSREVFPSLEDAVAYVLNFSKRTPQEVCDTLRDELRVRPDGKLTWKYDLRYRQSDAYLPEMLADMDSISRRLNQIVCPTLVVRGERSEQTSDSDAAKLATSVADGKWVRVAGAGHKVQVDMPHVLGAYLLKFLTKV